MCVGSSIFIFRGVLYMDKDSEEVYIAKIKNLQEQMGKISTEMNDLIDQMNSMLLLRDNWKRFVVYNILSGMLRGIGAAVGATVVFGLIIHILTQVIELNLPVISEWISMFINMVEDRRLH